MYQPYLPNDLRICSLLSFFLSNFLSDMVARGFSPLYYFFSVNLSVDCRAFRTDTQMLLVFVVKIFLNELLE